MAFKNCNAFAGIMCQQLLNWLELNSRFRYVVKYWCFFRRQPQLYLKTNVSFTISWIKITSVFKGWAFSCRTGVTGRLIFKLHHLETGCDLVSVAPAAFSYQLGTFCWFILPAVENVFFMLAKSLFIRIKTGWSRMYITTIQLEFFSNISFPPAQ